MALSFSTRYSCIDKFEGIKQIMIWLALVIVVIVVTGIAQQSLSDRNRRVLIDVGLFVLVIVLSGFLTRIIVLPLGSLLVAYFVGTPLAIIAGVGSILIIPIVFLALIFLLLIIIKKIRKL